jgi:hypothetical protein
MAIKTFTTGEVLTAADTNTYLANSGLVYITGTTFSNVASVTLQNCFSSTYDNYHLSFNVYGGNTAANYCYFQLGVGTTPTTTSYLSKSMWWDIGNPSTFVFVNCDGRDTGMSLGPVGFSGAQEGSYDVDVHYPFASRVTRMSGHGSGLYAGVYFTGVSTAGYNSTTTSFNSIKLLPVTSTIYGTIDVYGYRKA